jgi:hypothetical protein
MTDRVNENSSPVNIGFTLIRVFAASMLIGALAYHPYGYYVSLRWIVCAAAAYGIMLSVKATRRSTVWGFGIIAVLFNPFIPVHMTRGAWAPFNVGAAVFFLISLVTLRAPSDHDQHE